MDLVFPTEHGVFNYRVAGIFVKDGHVLIHRNVRDDFWALPGGRVTLGEKAATALARELHEELNMRVTDTSFAFVHENLFTYNDQPFHEIGLYFY
ncbi:MAG: NUDIX domain-containing protein, partial [Exiguobacterium sp.]|nr:NUDIX domain-containing protein [Exiguobacterium sp.]